MENEAVVKIEENISDGVDFLSKIWDSILHFLPTLIFALVVYIVCAIVMKIVMKLVDKGGDSGKIDKTIYRFLRSLISIAMKCITVITVLSVLGVPMTSIIAVITTAGVAIGLALKDSLGNIAGGFLIMITKPFKIGDYVSFGGVEGTVEEIGIVGTAIRTVDNKIIHCPNGSVSTSTVTNFSEEATRRVDINFSIDYEDDFRKAEKIIGEVLSAHRLILDDPVPTVRVVSHADSAIVLTTRAWVKTENYWDVYFDLMEQVKEAFDKNGISIPFNKLDVNVRNDEK